MNQTDSKTPTGSRSRLTVTEKMAMTAGAVAAIAPVSANADIIYIDSNPVSLSAWDGQGSTANWDVDGVNGVDFQMWVRSSAFFNSTYYSSNSFRYSYNFYAILNFASRSYNGAQLNGRGLVGPGGIRASALFNSFNVGPTLSGGYQWGVDDVQYRSMARVDSAYYRNQSTSTFFFNSGVGQDFVNFQQGPNFMGFRFDSAGNTHYGWAEVEFAGVDVTITRWAYESTPDTPIHVGSIPSPGALALLGMGAAGLLRIRRNRENI